LGSSWAIADEKSGVAESGDEWLILISSDRAGQGNALPLHNSYLHSAMPEGLLARFLTFFAFVLAMF
jgi:hypothetical protein